MDTMIRFSVANGAAAFVELFLYGVYSCLFVMAMSVMSGTGRSNQSTTSSYIFMAATIFMFIIATLHAALGAYRIICAFIVSAPPTGLSYLNNATLWHFRANNVLLCVMTWIGDALVIYRCYFIWNHNIWIIILPSLLLAATIAVDSFVLYWWDHPFYFGDPTNQAPILPWLNSIFPLSFTQNIMTTSLIAFKIWRQYRASSAIGVVDRSSRLSLVRILRIIIESAMIYTVQLLLLIIFYFRGDELEYVMQAAIVPSIGIVFVLIAVRVHSARSSPAAFNSEVPTIPRWLGEDESNAEIRHSETYYESQTRKLVPDDHPSRSSCGPQENRNSITCDVEKQS